MHHSTLTTLRGILIGLLLCLPAAVMAAPINDTFDHFTTGFPLTGGHRSVECDACHTAGQFRGTPRECASCHNLLTNTGAVIKSSAHIQSNNACDVCHSTLAWDDVRRVNHMAVLGRCVSCHNNITTTGLPASGHLNVAADSDCIDCHRTSTWASVHFNHAANMNGKDCYDCHNGTDATGAPGGTHTTHQDCNLCHNTHNWRFSHGSVTSVCDSCHTDSGAIATPKGGTHWQTTEQCSYCHTTTNWGFRHPSASTCLSCHNGTNASGLPGGHMNTNGAECIDCHRTSSWAFVHPSTAGACTSCHDGTIATGKPGNHFVTTLECNACHTTKAWTPASFGHKDPTYPPDHGWSSDCGRCHSGSPQSAANVNVYDYSSQVRDCIDCHYSDFRKEHKDSKLPAYQNCLSGCHEHSMRKF